MGRARSEPVPQEIPVTMLKMVREQAAKADPCSLPILNIVTNEIFLTVGRGFALRPLTVKNNFICKELVWVGKGAWPLPSQPQLILTLLTLFKEGVGHRPPSLN